MPSPQALLDDPFLDAGIEGLAAAEGGLASEWCSNCMAPTDDRLQCGHVRSPEPPPPHHPAPFTPYPHQPEARPEGEAGREDRNGRTGREGGKVWPPMLFVRVPQWVVTGAAGRGDGKGRPPASMLFVP